MVGAIVTMKDNTNLGNVMNKNNISTAQSYYQAMSNKDIGTCEKYLHPDVEFIGPLSNISGKESVVKSVAEFMNFFKHLTMRTALGSEDEVTVIYDVDFPGSIGTMRTAVLMNFKDGLIFRYELFFDTRPFSK